LTDPEEIRKSNRMSRTQIHRAGFSIPLHAAEKPDGVGKPGLKIVPLPFAHQALEPRISKRLACLATKPLKG
jgi:hypothetical protein